MVSRVLDADELVSVAVPRRFYPLVIQTLASALAAESTAADPTTRTEKPWTAEEVRHLRRVAGNKTVIVLMDLVCASPGTRVTFQQIYERAGRTYGQARADLAGLTKLVRQRFNRDNWPVHVVQGADKSLTYDADPAIAAAWNDTRE